MALATNPYIAGAPLRAQSGFYGRKGVLEWVERELRNPNTNALVLFGQRRVGKTTLLLQLQRTLPQDAFLPIYFDLQDQARRSLGTVLADLADTISERVGISPPAMDAFDDDGRFFQARFLADLYTTLDGRRLVLLLDEFDVLDQVAERELPESAATKALFPFLRRLMLQEPALAFVFVVGRRAEDLTLDFTATFKASLTREVWALDRESAVNLIRQAEIAGTLSFSDSAIERVLDLSSGHPYLIQLLCQRMWERAHAQESGKVPLVEPPFVDATVPNSLEAGYQAFAWLWDGLSPAEKIYTAAFAEATEEGGTIAEDQVIHILAAHAARLRTREVEMAPQDLVRRRVLVEVGDHVYRFNIELFRRWIRAYKPLREVKDELDQIDPLADQTFEVGRSFYLRRNWEVSARYFRDALLTNPRHLKALLFLGEALMAVGETDQAVIELEKAFALDRDEARLPLARALIANAKSHLNNGDEDAALAQLDRALQLSPQEHEALQVKADIWIMRGNQALDEEDLESALAAYDKAGSDEKSNQVKALIQERSIASLESEALSYERSAQWAEAAHCYEQLLAQDVNEEKKTHWLHALERATDEAELSRLFAGGLSCLEEEKWDQAQRVFADIVHRRPAYAKDGKLAIRLLEKAVNGENSLSIWKRPSGWVIALGSMVVLLLVIWGVSEIGGRTVPGQFDLILSTIASESSQPASTQTGSVPATKTAIATPSTEPVTNTPTTDAQVLDTASVLLESYYEKKEEGSVNEALAIISDAIQLMPDEASYYYERAKLNVILGRNQLAMEDIEQAIDLDADDPSYFALRGDLHFQARELHEAIADYSRSIARDPGNAYAYQTRGEIYAFHLNEVEKGLADFDRAIELDPDTAYLYEQRGQVYGALGNQESAEADWERCLELDPELYWCHLFLGVLYQGLGDTGSAVSHYREYLTVVPESESPESQDEAVEYIRNNAPGEVELFASGFNGPFGMDFDQDRNLYVANEVYYGIDKVISHDGRVSSFDTELMFTNGLAFDSSGLLHVSDAGGQIYRVSESGDLAAFVDSAEYTGKPSAIAFDSDDYLYFVNCDQHGTVYVFDPEGVLVNQGLAVGNNCLVDIIVDENAGVLYVSNDKGNIYQVDKATGDYSLYATTGHVNAGGLAADEEGNLYIPAWGPDQVLRIDAADQSVSVCLSGIAMPRGLAFDSRGILYITAHGSGKIYRAIGCQP